jgi:hypothetical protein
MKTPANSYQFIEKLCTSPSGEQFRVVFAVHVVNGVLKGRIVSVQPVVIGLISVLPSSETDQRQPCLPVFHSQKKPETIYIPAFTHTVSPYIELYFFHSQPTRAPSH